MNTNWSRRGLLLSMAAAAVESRAATVKLPNKVRLGVIGYDGHVDGVLRPLSDFPDVELVAVADAGSDPGAIRSVLRNPSVAKARRYTTYAEMLDKESLDCVGICNNNGERAAAIVACAERKVNLIAEKPYATSRKDLNAAIAAIEKNRVHAGMLLPMRFAPNYMAM